MSVVCCGRIYCSIYCSICSIYCSIYYSRINVGNFGTLMHSREAAAGVCPAALLLESHLVQTLYNMNDIPLLRCIPSIPPPSSPRRGPSRSPGHNTAINVPEASKHGPPRPCLLRGRHLLHHLPGWRLGRHQRRNPDNCHRQKMLEDNQGQGRGRMASPPRSSPRPRYAPSFSIHFSH